LDESARSLFLNEKNDGLMRDHRCLGGTRCALEQVQPRSILGGISSIAISGAPVRAREKGAENPLEM
jgi:hypothetical protein